MESPVSIMLLYVRIYSQLVVQYELDWTRIHYWQIRRMIPLISQSLNAIFTKPADKK